MPITKRFIIDSQNQIYILMNKHLLVILFTFQIGLCQDLIHVPPESFIKEVPYILEVIPYAYENELTGMALFVRNNHQNLFQEIPFLQTDYRWTAILDASFFRGDTLQYYIAGLFENGEIVGIPGKQPHLTPYNIPIKYAKNIKAKPLDYYENRILRTIVTPWKKSNLRPNSSKHLKVFGIRDAERFDAMGYLKIEANYLTSVSDILAYANYVVRKQGGDSIRIPVIDTYTRGWADQNPTSIIRIETEYGIAK